MTKSVMSSENSSLTADSVDEAWPLLVRFVKTILTSTRRSNVLVFTKTKVRVADFALISLSVLVR